MEKYVLEALYQMGYEKEAMTRIKDRYGDMVDSPLTTLWEFWDPNSGTQNHAWTGGPLTMMSMYAAGVSPVEPGYTKFKVAPQLGTMNKIDAKVPTVKGEINVKVERKGSGDKETIDVWTNVPNGTKALIGVPKLGGDIASKVKLGDAVIWENGADVAGAALTSVDQDNLFVYYESATAITLTAAKGLKVKLEGIALTPSSLSLTEGDKGRLEVSFLPADTTDAKDVSYSVEPADVLSVAQDGSYTALKVGNAVITATSSVGGYKASCTVVVQAKAGGGQPQTPGDQPQAPGGQTPEIPADTGKKDDVKDTVTVEPVTKLATPLKQITLAVKAKVTLPVVAYDNKGAIAAKLTWTSGNPAVASVDADTGRITAKKAGTAKITAAAQTGRKVTITVKVVKKAKAIKKIALVKPPKSLKKGRTAQLKLKVTPVSAAYSSIVFRSSKPGVVSVDKAGMLTAKKKGSAVITVKVGKRSVTHKITVK
jgi:uncharacterized protein YjdB